MYFLLRVSVSIFFHFLLYILFIYEVIKPNAANIELHYGELPRLKISCKPDSIIFCANGLGIFFVNLHYQFRSNHL